MAQAGAIVSEAARKRARCRAPSNAQEDKLSQSRTHTRRCVGLLRATFAGGETTSAEVINGASRSTSLQQCAPPAGNLMTRGVPAMRW